MEFRAEIIDKTLGTQTIKGVDYDVVKLRIADFECYAYLRKYYDLADIKHIVTDKVEFTDIKPSNMGADEKCQLAFVVSYYTEWAPTPESPVYKPMEFFNVEVHGIINKPAKFAVKTLSNKRDFCICDIRIRNRFAKHKAISIPVVAFNGNADTIAKFRNHEHVLIYARLKKCFRTGNLELNTTSIIVDKEV